MEFGSYSGEFEGLVVNMERRFRETNSDWMRDELATFMNAVPCPECHGKRLNPISLAVTVGDKSIMDITEMSIDNAAEFFGGLKLSGRDEVSPKNFKGGQARLAFLRNVGLGLPYASPQRLNAERIESSA